MTYVFFMVTGRFFLVVSKLTSDETINLTFQFIRRSSGFTPFIAVLVQNNYERQAGIPDLISSCLMMFWFSIWMISFLVQSVIRLPIFLSTNLIGKVARQVRLVP